MVEIVSTPGERSFYAVSPRYRAEFESRWFDPSFWGASASLVSSGGRGSAWFIDDGERDWVLRHYRRGGLVARMVSNHFLYTGMQRIRSFRELFLLEELFAQGLPVPEPVAAACYRRHLFYSGAIMMERLEGTAPMGACLNELSLERWSQVGAVVRRFHDYGVRHADLNCFNILLRDHAVYLIDFDKAVRQPAATDSVAKWKQANLARLQRSLIKVFEANAGSFYEQGWQALLDGYHSGSPQND